MRVLATLAVFPLLLAGCAEPALEPGPSSTASAAASASATGTATAGPAAPPRAPSYDTLDLSWDGSLGAGADACAVQVGCHGAYLAPASSEKIVNVTEGRLRSAHVTLEWTAQSPATQELGLVAMVMDHCSGCNVTILDSVTGPSPLAVNVTGLDLGVGERNWLHVFVYNPAAARWVPGAGGVYATPDQAFRVTGADTVQTA